MASNKPEVLIVGDRRRPGVAEGVESHRAWLAERLRVLDIDLDERLDLRTLKADLVLVFGGDGSILHVARRLHRNPVPLLGVNYGRFGFLADLAPEDLRTGIEAWLAGKFVTSQRSRLAVEIRRGSEVLESQLAVNDVVVGRNAVGAMIDIDVHIDGQIAISYSGDGLIIATPTGSTAHAMAAGGPLVDPTVAGTVVVPIAPHSLGTRPLVLHRDHEITLRVSDRSRAASSVSVDGTPALRLGPDDRVVVQGADAPVQLLRVSGRPFYDALRSKLGWRGRPDYRDES